MTEISKADGSTVYTLKRPIAFTRGDIVEKVTIRRMKVKDIRAAEKRSDFSSVEMVRLLSGLDDALLDEMDAEDFFGVSEIVLGFLPSALRIGKSA